MVYKTEKPVESKTEKPFPSPLEVDRFLYLVTNVDDSAEVVRFPSPRGVDRFLYAMTEDILEVGREFPSPRGVDRLSYWYYRIKHIRKSI